jgi:hypothetical protein
VNAFVHVSSPMVNRVVVEPQLRADVMAPDTIQTTTNIVRPTAVHLGVLFVKVLAIGRHMASRAQPMLAIYKVVDA